MSRHNRRRTRGGYKASTSTTSPLNITSMNMNMGISMGMTGNYYSISNISNSSSYHRPSPTYPPGLGFSTTDNYYHIPRANPSGATLTSRPGISARHWHNRYMAWQARDRRQREERARLEEEKRSIFGGLNWSMADYRSINQDNPDVCADEDADADGDGLAEKMLEYFGGLDFIE